MNRVQLAIIAKRSTMFSYGSIDAFKIPTKFLNKTKL